MKKMISLGLVLLFALNALGQRTLKYTNPDADYERALRLFENEKYGAAQRAFQKVYNRIEEAHSEIKMSAEYHIAVCALELFNEDAEQLFIDFMKHHPQNPKIRKARFQLGRYNYRVKHWSGVIEWMEQVDVNDLEKFEVPEYHFKYGYALFKRKDSEAAKQHFYEAIDDTSSNYSTPALFYYAHLMYESENYETALNYFLQLKDDADFGAIVPFYISQIYYLQKKYDLLIKYAPPLIESASAKRSSEMARMLGEAYYLKKDYKNATVYLEKYIEQEGESDTQAVYQLAFSYWKANELKKAQKYFQKSAEMDSEIGQLSLYYLGNIYLKKDQKKSARNAYRFASKLDKNKEIQEDALFNYAKLSYELDIDPYHEAIIAMEKYIDTYPNSKRVDEARKYLLNVYLNTQNYDRALAALEEIQDKNMDLQYAYQKISYYRGVELFNNERIGFGEQNLTNYKAAITYFNRAAKYPIDAKIAALCHYWTAEAYYRIDHFDKAVEYYKKFKTDPTASLLDEFKSVDYNIGYALWGMREYGPAIRSFRSFLTSYRKEDNKALDARIRIADGFLILRINEGDIQQAVNYYKKAISLKGSQTDYCYFQLAQAYKLLNEYTLQAEALEDLILKFPTSKYTDDAKFAIGETYLHHLQKYDMALKYFEDIVNNHPNNIELSQEAYNSMGFTYRNKKQHEKALEAFEKSVALNPRSTVAQGAIQAHKETCVNELGDAERHINFRENIGLPSLSLSAKDSSVFNAAKKFYLEGEYRVAVKNLEGYLNDYPKALFRTTALYFLGDAYLQQKDSAKALENFDKVIEMPKGEFTESALYNAGTIYYMNDELNKAIVRFKALEETTEYDSYRLQARIGLMRSYQKLVQNESTVEYAAKVIKDPKVDNNTKYEAILYKGKAHLALFEFNRAILEFEKISDLKQKAIGAEASYNLAYIDYLNEKYEESSTKVYAIAKEYSGFKYWVTKSFLLLSDNFVKQGDLFQAKYVLKTVIENTKDEDLKLEAMDRISAIEKMERAQNQPKEKSTDNWQVGEMDEEQQKLFENEVEEEEPLETPVMENDTIR